MVPVVIVSVLTFSFELIHLRKPIDPLCSTLLLSTLIVFGHSLCHLFLLLFYE